jgi:uncharacterized protein DUF6011
MLKNEIAHDQAIEFMLGGKAWVNIFNSVTENQRRFFIKAYDPKKSTLDGYRVLGCPTASRERIFLGSIINGTFIMAKDLTIEEDKKFAGNFNWIWKNLLMKNLEPNIHILHLGSCSVCGRPLEDAESLAIGIGPICLKRIHKIRDQKQLQIQLNQNKP